MSQTEPAQESLTPAILTDDKKSIQEEEREKILNVENEQKNTTGKFSSSFLLSNFFSSIVFIVVFLYSYFICTIFHMHSNYF